MPVIDADTHVDENEETWDYLDEKDRQYKPSVVVHETQPGATTPFGYNRYWLIDGQLRLKRVRDPIRTATTPETRELRDVKLRLQHMDERGVDIQVLYPTLFLTSVTSKPEVELALCRAYNRWLADKCLASNGRLRWLALPPLLSMDRAIEELRWAKEHGAVGVFRKGVEAGLRGAADPYFHPLYEEAQRLDLPICFHLGSGDPNLTDFDKRFFGMWASVCPVLDAFSSLIYDGMPTRYPKLRVGFIEAGSSWLPYVMADLRARAERLSWLQPFNLQADLLRESRFYLAYQTVEDLPYILQHGAEDNLVVGTDYGHADQSADKEALKIVESKGASGEVPAKVARKMLDDNPRALYGL